MLPFYLYLWRVLNQINNILLRIVLYYQKKSLMIIGTSQFNGRVFPTSTSLTSRYYTTIINDNYTTNEPTFEDEAKIKEKKRRMKLIERWKKMNTRTSFLFRWFNVLVSLNDCWEIFLIPRNNLTKQKFKPCDCIVHCYSTKTNRLLPLQTENEK